MPFKFEKLLVWQKSVELAQMVYEPSNKFPPDGQFGLTSQIRRAANLVSLNIVEGSTAQSNREFSKFLSIALRSNLEVVACLFLAKRRPYIFEEEFQAAYKQCEEILVMINALRRSLA